MDHDPQPLPPPVRGIAGNAATRVEEISATIAGLTERVYRIGDRAFGPVPQAAGTEGSKEVSASGEVGRLKDSFRKIEAQLKELTNAIERITEL